MWNANSLIKEWNQVANFFSSYDNNQNTKCTLILAVIVTIFHPLVLPAFFMHLFVFGELVGMLNPIFYSKSHSADPAY